MPVTDNRVTWLLEMVADDKASIAMSAMAKSMDQMTAALKRVEGVHHNIAGITLAMKAFSQAAINTGQALSQNPLFSVTGVKNLRRLDEMATTMYRLAAAAKNLNNVSTQNLPQVGTIMQSLLNTMAPYATVGVDAAKAVGMMARQINNLAASFDRLAKAAPAAGTALPLLQQTAQVMNQMPQGANLRVSAGAVKTAQQQPSAWATSSLGMFSKGPETFERMTSTLGAAASKLGLYYSSFLLLSNAHQAMIGIIKELGVAEEEFIDVKKYLPATESVGRLKASLYELSQAYGATSNQVLQAYNTFAQQGLKVNEILAVTKSALLASNIAATTFEESVSAITAVTKVYNLQLDRSTEIVDKIAIVQARSAVSGKDLISAFLKAGSVAESSGSSFEFFNGLVAAAAEKTRQSGDIIGNALKTILERVQRLSSIKSLKSIAPLSDIQFSNNKGELSSSEYVLSEIAKRWENLTDVQRKQVGETIAAGRQINVFLAIMNNWKTVSEQVKNQQDALGFSAKANMTEMDKLSRQWERFRQIGLETGSVFSDSIYPWLTNMVKALNDSGAATYLMATAVGVLGSAFAMLMASGIVWFIGSIGAVPILIATAVGALGAYFGGISKGALEVRKAAAENDAFAQSIGGINDALRKFKSVGERIKNIPNEVASKDEATQEQLRREGVEFEVVNGVPTAKATRSNLGIIARHGISRYEPGQITQTKSALQDYLDPRGDINKQAASVEEAARLMEKIPKDQRDRYQEIKARVLAMEEIEKKIAILTEKRNSGDSYTPNQELDRLIAEEQKKLGYKQSGLKASGGVSAASGISDFKAITEFIKKYSGQKIESVMGFTDQEFDYFVENFKKKAMYALMQIREFGSTVGAKVAGSNTQANLLNDITAIQQEVYEKANAGRGTYEKGMSSLSDDFKYVLEYEKMIDDLNIKFKELQTQKTQALRRNEDTESIQKELDTVTDSIDRTNAAYSSFIRGFSDSKGNILDVNGALSLFGDNLNKTPSYINQVVSSLNGFLSILGALTNTSWVIKISTDMMGQKSSSSGSTLLGSMSSFGKAANKQFEREINITNRLNTEIFGKTDQAIENEKAYNKYKKDTKDKPKDQWTDADYSNYAKSETNRDELNKTISQLKNNPAITQKQKAMLDVWQNTVLAKGNPMEGAGGGAERKAQRMEKISDQNAINAEQAKYNVLKEQELYFEKEIDKHISSHQLTAIRKMENAQREAAMYSKYAKDSRLSPEDQKKYQGMADTASMTAQTQRESLPQWADIDKAENAQRQQEVARKSLEKQFELQQKLAQVKRSGGINDTASDTNFALVQQRELIDFKQKEYDLQVKDVRAKLEAEAVNASTSAERKALIETNLQNLEVVDKELLTSKEALEVERQKLELIQAQGDASMRKAAIEKVSGILFDNLNPITIMKENDEKNKKRAELQTTLTKQLTDASGASGDVANAEASGNIDKINAAREKYKQINDQITQTKNQMDQVNEKTNKWKKVLEDIGNSVIKKIFDKIAGGIVDGAGGLFKNLFGGGDIFGGGGKSSNSISAGAMAAAAPLMGGLTGGGKSILSMFGGGAASSSGSFMGGMGGAASQVLNVASGGSTGMLTSLIQMGGDKLFGGGSTATAGGAAAKAGGGLFGGGGISSYLIPGLIGYGVGKATKSKGAGALAGGVSGFLMGGVAGAVVGALGGLFGGGGDDEAPPPPPQREFYPVTKNTEALDRNTSAMLKLSEGVFNAPTAFDMPKLQATANASAVHIGTLNVVVGAGSNSSQVANTISQGVLEYQRNMALFTNPSPNVG